MKIYRSSELDIVSTSWIPLKLNQQHVQLNAYVR